MNQILRPLSFLITIILSCFYTQTQAQNVAAVNSAVPFLRIVPDARGGGMGDVGISRSIALKASFCSFSQVGFA